MQDKRIIVVYKENFKLTNLMLINGRELKHISMFPDMESGKRKRKKQTSLPRCTRPATQGQMTYMHRVRALSGFVVVLYRFIYS